MRPAAEHSDDYKASPSTELPTRPGAGPRELCSCWVCGGQYLSVFRETYIDISAIEDLGLTTLAEGVETTSEMEMLRADHVDEAQGYLFARPRKT